MGVGGSLDYLSGNLKRPSKFVQQIGLEWFFRLINQPWRWKRQLKLLKFIRLVIKEKWTKN
jgi:N-acetylglucosaminyldiphosphoundecaprenol N-acetyl-beta-D-mannosaminyltransferase